MLCGDSEMAEGSIWEALDKASHYGLDNLTAIVDVNRLGQSGPTELEWDMEAYRRRVEAFGCRAVVIDGHDLEQIDDAFALAERSQLPTVVLARTVKGKGVPEVEDTERLARQAAEGGRRRGRRARARRRERPQGRDAAAAVAAGGGARAASAAPSPCPSTRWA